MYQLKWAQRKKWSRTSGLVPRISAITNEHVVCTMNMTWEEHCVECAIPECYTTCALYEPRRDGACARFEYGIVPNYDFKGRYIFGADIRFKRWAKLEANLNIAYPARPVGHGLLKFISVLPTGLQKLFKYYHGWKENDTPYFDAFVIECYSPEKKPFTLLLEYFVEKARFRKTCYRHSFTIDPGYNFFSIPFDKFNMEGTEGFLYLYPENCDARPRLIFTWADFVKFKEEHTPAGPASKVKCVAWDLDNTLWKGILSEQEAVEPNIDAFAIVKKLDDRGILQTLISKNDFQPAWQKLEQLGVSEYFLFPEINWNRKSSNLKNIAVKFNLNLNSFAVIDDSPFERAEIKASLPQVRVYSDTQIGEIMALDEFDVPVTETAKSRRMNYITENVRSRAREEFDGSYDNFLRSCKMELRALVPTTNEDITRCWELVHRSNQLNLSGRRHSLDDFRRLIEIPDVLPIALHCKDRFGDYGIIGYLTINISSAEARVDDFVLSCRVAQKKVEQTFILSFASLLRQQGIERLLVRLVRSPKNKPFQKILADLDFRILSDDGEVALLKHSIAGEKIDIIDLSFENSVLRRTSTILSDLRETLSR